MSCQPVVQGFFDKRTFSVQYVVSDPATRKCAIIDPVLDYDEKSGSTATTNADRLLAYIEEQGLELEWILDIGHRNRPAAKAFRPPPAGRQPE